MVGGRTGGNHGLDGGSCSRAAGRSATAAGREDSRLAGLQLLLQRTRILVAEVDRYASGPAIDRCGTCNLCVNSCPTEAIIADATVDARRCLSYQTIENRGHCPEPLRPALEGMAFGCDICQDVCPLNLSPVQADVRFAPRAVADLGVLEIASLTPERYRELVPGTALARAKYDGLRRNAIYALGAAGAPSSLPVLEKLCADPSELVRGAARWAVDRIQRVGLSG